MQLIDNATQPSNRTLPASAAHDRPGEISREELLALTSMANAEFERYALLPSPGSAPPHARLRTDDGNAVSMPANVQHVAQDAAHAATSSAAPTTSWLNADGSLNEALPAEVLFQRVVENASDSAIVRAFAEWVCEAEFEEGDAGFISDGDAYDMSMSVRNEGNFLDPNLQDLAGEAMQDFADTRHRWNDRVVAKVVEQFEGLSSTAPGDLPGALQVFKHAAYGAMREEAMDILERCTRALVHSD
ncbi:hypothetical protein [Stenotrophomonas sp. PD6]|uniref:hypothetical protein n=1 Tax=Stenotrophomonas sp. PD6 TaxID=3368612 RepID=UPI003BA3BB33